MFGAIVSVVMAILKAIFGAGGSRPSAEAVATGNAAAANVDLAVAKTAETKSAAIAQAEVDAPAAPAAVITSLDKGEF